jgi:hypothetical protein
MNRGLTFVLLGLTCAGLLGKTAFADVPHATSAASLAASSVTRETVAAQPPAASSFPIHLQGYRTGVRDGWDGSLVSVTFKADVPGLSFCVSYSAAHGASIRPRRTGVGHIHQDDLETCLTTGRDGLVSDSVRVAAGKSPDALIIANVVLVDNRVNAEIIPLATSSAASLR